MTYTKEGMPVLKCYYGTQHFLVTPPAAIIYMDSVYTAYLWDPKSQKSRDPVMAMWPSNATHKTMHMCGSTGGIGLVPLDSSIDDHANTWPTLLYASCNRTPGGVQVSAVGLHEP